MNIYLEIFGYIGTALVILSMTMKSMTKLRVLNVSGSVIAVIYSALCNTWPTVVMNVCLIGINLYHLIQERLTRKKTEAERSASDAAIVNNASE